MKLTASPIRNKPKTPISYGSFWLETLSLLPRLSRMIPRQYVLIYGTANITSIVSLLTFFTCLFFFDRKNMDTIARHTSRNLQIFWIAFCRRLAPVFQWISCQERATLLVSPCLNNLSTQHCSPLPDSTPLSRA